METINSWVLFVLLVFLGMKAGRWAGKSKNHVENLIVALCAFWLIATAGERVIHLLFK